MKTAHKIMKLGLVAGLLSVAGSLFAYEVRIGQESVMPGALVQVPVLIDDATDVSTIQLQINYDPQLLTVTSVTNSPGTLGGEFALDCEDDDGVLILILYRADSLLSGSGELVTMTFEANTGSELLMESALKLAEIGLGNQDGKDLAWAASLSAVHGAVNIFPSSTADADGDGIPDRWEFDFSGGHTNLPATVDGDGDGLNNLQEYIAGTNPTNFDGFAQTLEGCNPVVLNWNSFSGRVYNVYWTTNLTDGFELIGTNVQWTAGCFTDLVHHAGAQGYYKVDVQIEP